MPRNKYNTWLISFGPTLHATKHSSFPLPGWKYWPKFFQYKAVNSGQNWPQMPLLTGKIPALTAFIRKNGGVNGVESEK